MLLFTLADDLAKLEHLALGEKVRDQLCHPIHNLAQFHELSQVVHI